MTPTGKTGRVICLSLIFVIAGAAVVHSEEEKTDGGNKREERVVYLPPSASISQEGSEPVPALALPPMPPAPSGPMHIPVTMASTRPDAGPGYGPDGRPAVSGDAGPWMPSSAVWNEDSRVIVRPVPYIQNRPTAGDRIDGPQSAHPPPPPQQPVRPPPSNGNGNGRPPARPGVTETDMYLIGAIEKLVYRVDFLEKRLRRAEELLRYLLEGAATGQQEVSEPCPKDFVRSGRLCLHLSGRDLNWKSASSACKAMDSMLVELPETEDARRRLLAWLYARPDFRGRDFWTGGLNPGLLWIWANSARPVVDSGNMTSPNGIPHSSNEVIRGNGRCLSMAWNPASRLYDYRAADCSARMRFVCQLEEAHATRALRRLQKALGVGADETSDDSIIETTTEETDDTVTLS